MSASAFIGVGSNIEPLENIRQALRLLRRRVAVTGVSTFYRTAPLGGRRDPPYVNGVWRVTVPDGEDGPRRLRRLLRRIETRLGRKRSADRYASRPIDLDLILYADRVIDPDIYSRPFLSLPLAELEPDLALPDSGRPEDMEPLAAFTRELRGET